MTTALVTGASGFAGAHLVKELSSRGVSVVAVTNHRSVDVAGVDQVKVEITDAGAVARAVDTCEPDVVFHLAAIVDTVETPDVYRLFEVNTLGTAAIVEAVRVRGRNTRLVFASSAFAYGAVPSERLPVVESEPLRPVTPYGASKAAAEAIIGQYSRAGGDCVVARAFTHTGPGHVGPYALADWGRQLAEIEAGLAPAQIACGNLDVKRDYLDVRDVVAAYIALADEGEAGATYNVASGVATPMGDLLRELVDVSGVAVELVVDRGRFRAVDQPSFYADTTKLRTSTSWQQQFTLRETLADLAAFWRERVAAGMSVTG